SSFQRLDVARFTLTTGVPFVVFLTSGSCPRLPRSVTLFTLAMLLSFIVVLRYLLSEQLLQPFDREAVGLLAFLEVDLAEVHPPADPRVHAPETGDACLVAVEHE